MSIASELLKEATKASFISEVDIVYLAVDIIWAAKNAASRGHTTLHWPIQEGYAKEQNFSRLVSALREDGFTVVDLRGSVIGGGHAIRLDWSDAK